MFWKTSHVGQDMLGDMLRGSEAGTRCSDSFPCVTCPFLRKSSVVGTKLSVHEIQLIMKQGQNFQCGIVCTFLANCPCYNREMN